MRPVIDERSDIPRPVAARRLNLDHVSAHVSQQAGAQMPLEVGQVEDAQAGQRAGFAKCHSSGKERLRKLCEER